MNSRITSWEPKERDHASWVRGVEAFARSVVDVTKIAGVWNSDAAPATVRTTLTTMPSSVLLLRATTGTGTIISGAPVTWTWDDGDVIISAIGTLTASTDYDIVIGVVM